MTIIILVLENFQWRFCIISHSADFWKRKTLHEPTTSKFQATCLFRIKGLDVGEIFAPHLVILFDGYFVINAKSRVYNTARQ